MKVVFLIAMDLLSVFIARFVSPSARLAGWGASALLLSACGHGAFKGAAASAPGQVAQNQHLQSRPAELVNANSAGAQALCNCPPANPLGQLTGIKATPNPAVLVATTLPAPAAGTDETVPRLLAYADQVRGMPANELGQESKRLADLAMPAEQLRLALVLGQSRQSAELARGQELVARVLANPSPEAQTLHPLARLVAFRLSEQRRQEETIERQAQQLRDVQRRLEQTTERLEALKAIERSINSSAGGTPNRAGNAAGSVGTVGITSRTPAARASAPRRPASASSSP